MLDQLRQKTRQMSLQNIEALSTMESWRALRSGIAASAVAHLSILALVLLFAEVHPFGKVTAVPIAVDIVTPEEIKTQPPKPPEPSLPDLSLADKTAAASPQPPAAQPAAAAQPPAASPQKQPAQKQAALAPATVDQRAQQPQMPQAAITPQTPPSIAPITAPIAQSPDLSIKYHVLLGLPPDRPDNGFDAPASTNADIAANFVAEFRSHLKTCAALPKSIARTDPVKIKLRVFMTPDGNLASEPILIEASASAKGPILMQSAIGALQACQPYGMLPADKYAEWKMLDLNFTPQDF
jgi:hypothetical protein